jgi:hypothetical protein
MIPYNNDTRESYIERMKAHYLELAERFHKLGYSYHVWLHLFTWVQCEEFYGDHWDKVKEKNA